jgi:hypothetical protein
LLVFDGQNVLNVAIRGHRAQDGLLDTGMAQGTVAAIDDDGAAFLLGGDRIELAA